MRAARRIVDAIVRSTTIELLASHGIAAAPTELAAETLAHQSVPVGSIPFSAQLQRGVLVLSIAEPTLGEIARGALEAHILHDCVRELTNELMGRIKNRFTRYHLLIQAGLPTAIDARIVRQTIKTASSRYAFRTLSGEVFVFLAGDLEEAQLVLSAEAGPAGEGDIVLF